MTKSHQPKLPHQRPKAQAFAQRGMNRQHPAKARPELPKATFAANPDAGKSAGFPPHGYRLVDDALYQIGLRDLVFHGGSRGGWIPARRAGDYGSLRRDSVALAVAVPA